jgi:hypothetical protein
MNFRNMRAAPPFLDLVNRALRTNFDAVANEPLPERWVDLLNHLNDRERQALDQLSEIQQPGRAT